MQHVYVIGSTGVFQWQNIVFEDLGSRSVPLPPVHNNVMQWFTRWRFEE